MTTGPGKAGSPRARQSAQSGAPEQVKDKAQEVAGEARRTLRSQVDERSRMAGERVRGQASDLRTVSDQLREQGKDGPAKLTQQAADRTEQLGSYLEESDADRILADVEEFARRKPWAIVAGGLAAGFVASRFLKASSSDRYQQLQRRAEPHQLPEPQPVGAYPEGLTR
jgi:ElaB/YqjD/DUF883 family membrane-anchored ribosome-binding protein